MTTTPTMIKTNSVLQTQKTFCLALVPRRPFNAAALCKKGRRNSFIKGFDTNTTTKAVHNNVVALSRFDDVNNNNDDDDDDGDEEEGCSSPSRWRRPRLLGGRVVG